MMKSRSKGTRRRRTHPLARHRSLITHDDHGAISGAVRRLTTAAEIFRFLKLNQLAASMQDAAERLDRITAPGGHDEIPF